MPEPHDALEVAPGTDLAIPGELQPRRPSFAPKRDRRPTRRRGWVGRGPVGLVAEPPPRHVRYQARHQAPGVAVWWFLTGAELDGKRRTNATWLRWGTRAYVWSDRMPTGWVAWPRTLRALVRLAGTAVAALVFWAYLHAPGPVTVVGGSALWAGLAWAGWAAGASLLGWPHRRRWVWPLHRTLVQILGYPARTAPRRYLFVSRDFRRPGGQVRVALPPTWMGVDEEADRGEAESKSRALVGAVRTKLAFSDIETHWRLAGDNHELVICPRFDSMPTRWAPSDVQMARLLATARQSELLLGVGRDGLVTVDLDSESPHLLLSMQSGEGKSVLLANIGSQVLHRGGRLTILDFKRRSLKCFKGVPNVHYCRDMEQMHLALMGLAALGQRRNVEADDWDESEAEPVFTRELLIIEETNATIYKLQLWWELNRRKDQVVDNVERYCGEFGDPSRRKSPAVLALGDILFMGRQSAIHVAAVGQYTTAQAMGGPAIREQFGARGIKGPQKAFAMLSPELGSLPVSGGPKGRIHLVMRGQATELQLAHISDRDARKLATSGARPQGIDVARSEPSATGPQVSDDVVLLGKRPVVATGQPPEVSGLVGLREAVERGVVRLSLTHLRSERARDPEFPQPADTAGTRNEHRYYIDELAAWDRNREGARDEEA